jgi:hypothetical protein
MSGPLGYGTYRSALLSVSGVPVKRSSLAPVLFKAGVQSVGDGIRRPPLVGIETPASLAEDR